MKPKRIWTVIFYISFLPYILGILWSIWNAATGIQMEGYVMYGISAFWTTIKLISLVFTLKIPLIPINSPKTIDTIQFISASAIGFHLSCQYNPAALLYAPTPSRILVK